MQPEVVGIDVGGSGVRAAPVAGDLRIPAEAPLSRDLDRGTVLERIIGVVDQIGAADVRTVVIAVPTFVGDHGRLLACPSLPSLEGCDLGHEFTARTSVARVRIVPDVAATVTGEATFGSGRDVDRFLCVALGTGANAAAIVSGGLVETAYGCLGDAGHVLVDPLGPACACGGRGCLEAIASAWALDRTAPEHGFADARGVIEAAEQYDPIARGLLAAAGFALGRAIATWACMLWPQRVAIAGGLAAAGEHLLEPARKEMQRVGVPYIVDDIEVVLADLGRRATLAGAVELARQDHARAERVR